MAIEALRGGSFRKKAESITAYMTGGSAILSWARSVDCGSGVFSYSNGSVFIELYAELGIAKGGAEQPSRYFRTERPTIEENLSNAVCRDR